MYRFFCKIINLNNLGRWKSHIKKTKLYLLCINFTCYLRQIYDTAEFPHIKYIQKCRTSSDLDPFVQIKNVVHICLLFGVNSLNAPQASQKGLNFAFFRISLMLSLFVASIFFPQFFNK